MPTPEQVFADYAAMWNTADEEQRRMLAEHSLTDDAVVLYASIEAYGRADAVTAAQRWHRDTGGIQIIITSGIEQHHGWCRAAWRIINADGSPGQDGQSVGELADDGRLRRALGFLDPLPTLP